MEEQVRLNKRIGASGFCSRRKADEWIDAGKVTVNGVVADKGCKVSYEDEIRVNGHLLEKHVPMKVVAFYKPKGYTCTAHRGDSLGIYKHFDLDASLKYIGRLDKDSEGLLLLTNDGNLCNDVAKARNQHEKEYIVRVNKPITEQFLKGMSEGVNIYDDNKKKYRMTNPCVIRQISEQSFSIILTQGMNRQIRRMCEVFHYRVVSLKRIRVMNILLGDKKPGDIWEIQGKELTQMKDSLQ